MWEGVGEIDVASLIKWGKEFRKVVINMTNKQTNMRISFYVNIITFFCARKVLYQTRREELNLGTATLNHSRLPAKAENKNLLITTHRFLAPSLQPPPTNCIFP